MSEHENSASWTTEADAARVTIDELAGMFRLLELEHALTGGHAVNQYTAPRLSHDLDFVVAGGVDAPHRCEVLLRHRGYESRRREGGTAQSPAFVRVKHEGRGISVDILEARTAWERQVLARARWTGDLPFPVSSPEDLVIGKLISDRQRDERDILELAAVPDLDLRYIRRWAETWDVLPVFERLLGSAQGRSF